MSGYPRSLLTKAMAANIAVFCTFVALGTLTPTSSGATSIILSLDTVNRTFNIDPTTGFFSNGNGQKIVSILEDGALNTTDPLIGTIVETQGFFSGNLILPFDPSGTLTDVATQIIANGSVIYSDLSPVAHFVDNEWFGLRTAVNLNNTISSPVLDVYAANAGWTYMVDSEGLVHPDSTPVPEPSTLWLFTTFTVVCLYAGMRGWRRRS